MGWAFRKDVREWKYRFKAAVTLRTDRGHQICVAIRLDEVCIYAGKVRQMVGHERIPFAAQYLKG